LALKIAFYGFFEKCVLVQDVSAPLIRCAAQDLDNALWTCRSLPFLGLRRLITAFRNRLLRRLGQLDASYVTPVEDLIAFADAGEVGHVLSAISDSNIFKMVCNSAPAFYWRLLADPNAPHTLLDRLRKDLTFESVGARAKFDSEKRFDLSLRESTSLLIRTKRLRHRRFPANALDPLLELIDSEQFHDGVGVANTHQRLQLELQELRAKSPFLLEWETLPWERLHVNANQGQIADLTRHRWRKLGANSDDEVPSCTQSSVAQPPARQSEDQIGVLEDLLGYAEFQLEERGFLASRRRAVES
jgi:hypothetical protein